MGNCFGGPSGAERQQVAINAKIEEQNKKDNAQQSRIIKFLLLGPGESGKSTLFKQIRIIHGKEYSKSELEEAIPVIHMNIFSNLLVLLEYALDNNYDFGSKKEVVDNFLVKYDKNSALKPADAEIIQAIWATDAAKRAWEERANYQVFDALQYFVENVERIAKPTYFPTITDYLYSRVRSTGIVEENYKIKGVNFKIMDVGGQRNERRKWIHCFDNVTAIIFVAAINEYDQMLWEDSKIHRITEALNLFKEVLTNKLFVETPIILFLNKIDLFREKLRHKKLQEVYPEFQGPYLGDPDVKDEVAFEVAQEFMREKFLAINETPGRPIYPYYTTATDKNNVDRVFDSTKDIVLQQALKGHFY